MTRFSSPFFAWLVTFGLLLNGLMPLVAHASEGGRFAEMAICSTSAGKQKAPVKPVASHLHCVHCCTGVDGPSLPSGAAHDPVRFESVSRTPRIALALPRVEAIPGLAQPRAPPARG